jgi:hypothetical protein
MFVRVLAICMISFVPGVLRAQPIAVYVDVVSLFAEDRASSRYPEPSSPWIYSETTNGYSWSRGDAGGEIGRCVEAAYLCLNTEALPFAFPKNGRPSAWQFRGKDYVVLDSDREISLLGSRHQVVVFAVDVPDEDPRYESHPWRYVFYFSLQAGLVAFSQEVTDCESAPPSGGWSLCGVGGLFVLTEGVGLFAGMSASN